MRDITALVQFPSRYVADHLLLVIAVDQSSEVLPTQESSVEARSLLGMQAAEFRQHTRRDLHLLPSRSRLIEHACQIPVRSRKGTGSWSRCPLRGWRRYRPRSRGGAHVGGSVSRCRGVRYHPRHRDRLARLLEVLKEPVHLLRGLLGRHRLVPGSHHPTHAVQ